jgi:tetratricopeptide (TPR) repeat protein
MRMIAGVLVALAVIAAPALAEDAAPADAVPPAAAADASRIAALDRLFAALKVAKSPDDAKSIETSIWQLWMESGDPAVDKLMNYTVAAMNARAYTLAVDFLDAIVKLKPDYAEGWNKRATVYWLLDDYGKSIADIERTLALEPRHFGALSGLGMIMRSMGEKQKAIDAFRRALDVDPNLEGVADSVKALEDELGKDI